jgi:hypothetical protein
MDHRITSAANFDWAKFCRLLAAKNLPIQLRMIDGELSFPDETPPESWRELRVSCAAGMLTLRRDAAGIAVVTWGNADAALRQGWNAVAWAVAEATGGTLDGQTPEDFAARAELPPGWPK